MRLGADDSEYSNVSYLSRLTVSFFVDLGASYIHTTSNSLVVNSFRTCHIVDLIGRYRVVFTQECRVLTP